MVPVRRKKIVLFLVVVGVSLIGLYRLNNEHDSPSKSLLSSLSSLVRSVRGGPVVKSRPNAYTQSTHIQKPTTELQERKGGHSHKGVQRDITTTDEDEDDDEIENTLDWIDRMNTNNDIGMSRNKRHDITSTDIASDRSINLGTETGHDQKRRIEHGRYTKRNDALITEGSINNVPTKPSSTDTVTTNTTRKYGNNHIGKEVTFTALTSVWKETGQISKTQPTVEPPLAITIPSDLLASTGPLTTPSEVRVSFYTPAPSQKMHHVCKLPKLDPWDPSIRHLLTEDGVDSGCRLRYALPKFEVMNNRLVVTNDNVHNIEFERVLLESIHRVGDDKFRVVSETSPLNRTADNLYTSSEIRGSDFLKLTYKLRGKDEESHYFARVVAHQDVVDNSLKLRNSASFDGKGLPLNVLMLGIDSTSHANFLRKMPHTLEFLRTKLKTYIMKGFSIVGDATTPALTALLTGRYDTDLPEGRRGYAGSGPLDEWPWISKQLEARGYATLYAEDDPSMSTFNLRLNGFVHPPYHHFMRPFWLALEEAGLRDDVGLCSQGVSMVNHTVDYLLSFFKAYSNTPKFAMGFLSYLAHAHPNHLSYADYDILSMLKQLVKGGYHNDTVIIVFGDHGSRNDDIRNTIQGKLEERLPWLSISVPHWLESEFPDVAAALSHNQHVISSPFDLHSTLRHILTYPDIPPDEKTQSLFTKLNESRGCRSAGVDDHWCPCLQFTAADVNSLDVERSAQAVVRHINKRLNSTSIPRMLCQQLQLTKIHSVMKYEPNDKVQRFSNTNQDTDLKVNFGMRTEDSLHYLITMETRPMGALFEATVTITNDGQVLVNPNISRINKYGSQPRCIASSFPYFRKFCVCKSFIQ